LIYSTKKKPKSKCGSILPEIDRLFFMEQYGILIFELDGLISKRFILGNI